MTDIFTKKAVIILVAVSIFLSFLPALRLLPLAESSTFFEAFTTNYSYYFARIHEIADGKPFIGNPYFFEHKDEPSVAFFGADWVASVPVLVGLPFGLAMYLNLLFWLCIFSFLVFLLLRLACVAEWLALLGTVVTLFSTYLFLIIPVSMQIILPFYIFFLCALLTWVKQPQSGWRSILLIIASASSFYIYTYLWQITLSTLLVVVILYCLKKEWSVVGRLFLIVGMTLIVALPEIFYTVRQINHIDYWDTVRRIGFVETYIPTLRAIKFSLWTFSAILVATLMRKYLSLNHSVIHIFILASGLALIGVSLSNFITGRELELGQHIPRFIVAWVPIVLALLVSVYLKYRKTNTTRYILEKYTLVALVILIGSFPFVTSTGYRYFLWGEQADAAKEEIVYRGKTRNAFQWLDQHEPTPIVVMVIPADTFAKETIPIFTRHYVLFSSTGILHLLPTKETTERWLLAHIAEQLTTNDFKSRMQEYAGIGYTTHTKTAKLRHNRLCSLVESIIGRQLSAPCDKQTTSPFNEEYFGVMLKQMEEMRRDPMSFFKKYHVSYLLLTEPDLPAIFKKLPLVKVYADDNNTIYKFPEML